MKQEIGIFGLGLIGMALARRLIGDGYRVIGFDPDVGRTQTLQNAGGQFVGQDDVWKADTIFSAVFDTSQLSEIIACAPPKCDKRLVSLSTCDPQQMAALGKAAAVKDLVLIEAPISGTSRQFASGDAILLVAGDGQTISQLTTIFTAISRAHYRLGELGNGNRAKLAINLVLGLNRAALAEGLVFAEKIGLKPAEFLSLARVSAASSQVMDTKGPLMINQSFEPQGRILQSAKDFNLIRQIAGTKGQGLPFAETYAKMMDDCIQNGEGELDNSAIIRAVGRNVDAHGMGK